MNPESVVMVQLNPSKRTNYIQMVVKCPFCNKKHYHGPGEGWRATHCVDKQTGKSSSRSYYLEIDWSIPAHAKLKERYAALEAE